MRALIIDTSTERGLVSLLDNQNLKMEKLLPFGLQSKHLMPTITQAFSESGLKIAELDCIGVGIGPGSYTGMRVAVATAQALNYASRRPLIGFSSLYAFTPEQDGTFIALIDAKIGGAYYICGSKQGDSISYSSDPSVLPLQELLPYLDSAHFIVTPFAHQLKTKLLTLYPDKHWSWLETPPNLSSLYRILQQKYNRKEWTLDGRLELLYLRKTQAEISIANYPSIR